MVDSSNECANVYILRTQVLDNKEPATYRARHNIGSSPPLKAVNSLNKTEGHRWAPQPREPLMKNPRLED